MSTAIVPRWCGDRCSGGGSWAEDTCAAARAASSQSPASPPTTHQYYHRLFCTESPVFIVPLLNSDCHIFFIMNFCRFKQTVLEIFFLESK